MDLKEQVKSKTDIVNVVGKYVDLKKAGSNYKGLCPFHSENTPSFTVSQEMQFFKCFGCGKAGDAITFLMEMEGIEFKDALKQLAEEANIDVTEFKFEGSVRNQILYEINEKSQNFFEYTLLNLDIGKKALDYLKNRGLTVAQIKEFKLGYAPHSWNSLYNFLKNKGYKEQDIEKAGLIKKGKSDYYDVYRGRVMFPLENQGGKIVGFAGRTVFDEEPKYINTKETPIFYKSEFIFNLYKAKTEIRRKNEVIVTEGEFDAITPFLKGIKNIVALKGTSFTSGQANLLKRYAETAVIFFDSDAAGDNAAVRGIEIAQNNGLNVKIATLPSKYKDPDEAAKESIDILYKATDNAVPAYDYFLQHITKKYDKSDPYGKKKIVEFLKPKIQNIKDPILKDHYTKKLAELVNISEESLQKVQTNVINYTNTQTETKTQAPIKNETQKIEPLFVYMLRSNKEVFAQYYENIFKNKLLSTEYLEALQEYKEKVIDKKLNKAEFIENAESKLITKDIFLQNIGGFEESIENQQAVLQNITEKYKKNRLKVKIGILTDKLKEAERLQDKQKLDKLQKKFTMLTRQLTKLK